MPRLIGWQPRAGAVTTNEPGSGWPTPRGDSHEEVETIIEQVRQGREPTRRCAGQLHDVLVALGFIARERVSINTKAPGGRFESTIYRVGDLAGWSPPQDRDVWFGVNPVGRPVRYGRGTEADITRVHTLFADFDVKYGKQFDKLDQCYTAARSLADYLSAEPVALVESGHGLQPLWRIGSPIGDSNVVDRDRTRDEWKTTYQRWGTMVHQAARDAMWSPDGAQNLRTIDNVFDLSRVMRCPGSINWKNPDNPVPVRTRVFDHRGCVRASRLVAGRDRDNVSPLAMVRPVAARVQTSFGEADTWIHEQPGATTELAELRQLPRGALLWQYLDVAELVQVLGGAADGAHLTMATKVQHAVYAAQEGRAGLVVALNNIADAYAELMEARLRGEMAGEVRSAGAVAEDFQRAVVGAVAKARGRPTPRRHDASKWRVPDASRCRVRVSER